MTADLNHSTAAIKPVVADPICFENNIIIPRTFLMS
jgi:hypothetical protein